MAIFERTVKALNEKFEVQTTRKEVLIFILGVFLRGFIIGVLFSSIMIWAYVKSLI